MSDREAIEAGVTALAEAFTAGDVDAVMALFGPEPVTFPPHESLREGRESIRTWHAAVFDQFEGRAVLTPVDIDVSGDMAVVSGRYVMDMVTPDGTEVGDRGKFIQVWKRREGQAWKLARNIWNSDEPPSSG